MNKRKLVLGAMALTKARNNRSSITVAQDVRDELEKIIISSKCFEAAPFKYVGLIFHYGIKNDEVPKYKQIDSKDGELPITIELDTYELRSADRTELKRLFTVATLKALIDVAIKYKLPKDQFIKHLKEIT